MAGIRLNLDFYFDKMTIEQVKAAYPALFTEIKKAKGSTSIINAGKDNEEKTVRAVYHVCYHNEKDMKPCEPEQEI